MSRLTNTDPLTADQRRDWDEKGFFLIKGFASRNTLDDMLANVVRLCREADGSGVVGDAIVQAENVHAGKNLPPEQRVSKVFRIHRQERVFREFCSNPAVTALLEAVMGENIDCFLSQFIFKTPGAIGQPWHQDSWYFPFSTDPQVGVWLAVTEADMENGPLWILPGSHTEPVHAAIPDPRPVTQRGYVEIVDHDMSDEVPLMLDPGDMLVFHSHLMHKSTDNVADYNRAAMVWHYAIGDTVDLRTRRGSRPPMNQDWMPVLRNGVPA